MKLKNASVNDMIKELDRRLGLAGIDDASVFIGLFSHSTSHERDRCETVSDSGFMTVDSESAYDMIVEDGGISEKLDKLIEYARQNNYSDIQLFK